MFYVNCRFWSSYISNLELGFGVGSFLGKKPLTCKERSDLIKV